MTLPQQEDDDDILTPRAPVAPVEPEEVTAAAIERV